jgi:phosphoglycerol transferase MdoB-like AlkP superfamily enzyme
MRAKTIAYLQDYARAMLALVVTACSVRVYEYFAIARKSFVNHAFYFELAGWVYDIWTCLLYGLVLLLPYLLLRWINKRLAIITVHVLNILMLIVYLSLIVVFSERNTPFDHEIFTRSLSESWLTAKQMMTSGVLLYLPFVLYIAMYFVLYGNIYRKMMIGSRGLFTWAVASLLAVVFIKYANPPESWFKQKAAYHFTSNKFSYWVNDNYIYFRDKNKFDASRLTKEELDAEIDFYQKNQPFNFTGREYPLVHSADSTDVLGSFFNLDPKQPPNIVIVVVEGLSRDFSGDKAYAGSFTPFLDSLSRKSLAWDNFLSTAPGTFAAHPAISGSLPYGKRGFSVINVMPDHLSLIKILRSNGYHTKFLIGFNPDFDNMGGYMRLQGTDMILSKYGSKYKEMGVGSEGWSMGYPDDALFNRSFEVMDSLPQTPYLNIYHTGTTHMPYLFEQKKHYDKLFDKKMKALPDTVKVKRTLKDTKEVLVTYMFADDCFRDFFAKYSRRPDYKNTIFFITGDHHIGSFPSTCSIDDYHVPLIVYSPMLKAPKKFYSVNSHNNLAPTISSLVLNNYPVAYKPKEVHWLAGVIDTAALFRNVQSMPFMAWSREMTDYLYKGYFLSGKELYRLTPDLLQEKIENDSVKQHMTRLLENFKLINSYVCDNNKIYPAAKAAGAGKRELLLDYSQPATQTFFTRSPDTTIMPEIAVPKQYKYLYIELSAETNLRTPGPEDQPSFRMALIDTSKLGRNFVFWTHHNIVQIAKGDYIEKQWNAVSTNDMFTLNDYKQYKNLVFDLSFYTQVLPMNLQLRNLKIRLYGIR